MAVVYLDLDGFKQINDTLGHVAGDEVLKTVARRLESIVREEDTVARVGGDEFMIALWQITNGSDLAFVATKLVEIFRNPFSSKVRLLASPRAPVSVFIQRMAKMRIP